MGKIRGTHTSPGVYTRPWTDRRKKVLKKTERVH